VNDALVGTNVAPFCVDREGLAALLKVSPRTVRRLDDRGKIPEALQFGGCKRWSVAEIEAWIAAGAPPRSQWRSMRT
jgi:predicted DNA-binding transcriptional regulator AlpA